MNIPCAVAQDLLPLYAEKLVSEESKTLLEEHLEGCAACRGRLEALRQPAERAAEGAAPMKTLKKELRRRRGRAAAIAALTVFVLLFALFARATDGKPLPYSPERLRVEGVEPYNPTAGPRASAAVISAAPDGWQSALPGQALVIRQSGQISGIQQESYLDEDTGELTVYLQFYSTQMPPVVSDVEWAKQDTAAVVFYPVPDRVIYGFGDRQELLWGEPMNGGMQILPRLALAFYVLLAAGLTALFAILWLVLRKKPCTGILRQLGFAPLSYLLAQLLVKGGETTTLFLLRDLLLIVLEAAALYALLTLVSRAWRQRRAERAE